MTPYEFFRLVERMRQAQREYFRTRSSAVLRDSKRLEKDVDAEIERANRFIHERRNPKLNFDKTAQ